MRLSAVIALIVMLAVASAAALNAPFVLSPDAKDSVSGISVTYTGGMAKDGKVFSLITVDAKDYYVEDGGSVAIASKGTWYVISVKQSSPMAKDSIVKDGIIHQAGEVMLIVKTPQPAVAVRFQAEDGTAVDPVLIGVGIGLALALVLGALLWLTGDIEVKSRKAKKAKRAK